MRDVQAEKNTPTWNKPRADGGRKMLEMWGDRKFDKTFIKNKKNRKVVYFQAKLHHNEN